MLGGGSGGNGRSGRGQGDPLPLPGLRSPSVAPAEREDGEARGASADGGRAAGARPGDGDARRERPQDRRPPRATLRIREAEGSEPRGVADEPRDRKDPRLPGEGRLRDRPPGVAPKHEDEVVVSSPREAYRQVKEVGRARKEHLVALYPDGPNPPPAREAGLGGPLQ